MMQRKKQKNDLPPYLHSTSPMKSKISTPNHSSALPKVTQKNDVSLEGFGLPPDVMAMICDNLDADNPEIKKLILNGSITHTQSYSSPWPHPAILKGLEEVYPGASKSIFSLVEKEQAKQHQIADAQIRKMDMETEAFKNESLTARNIAESQIRSNSLIIKVASIVVIVFVGASVYLAIEGKNEAALIFGGSGGAFGLLSVFRKFLPDFKKNKK